MCVMSGWSSTKPPARAGAPRVDFDGLAVKHLAPLGPVHACLGAGADAHVQLSFLQVAVVCGQHGKDAASGMLWLIHPDCAFVWLEFLVWPRVDLQQHPGSRLVLLLPKLMTSRVLELGFTGRGLDPWPTYLLPTCCLGLGSKRGNPCG